jgi:hypothetical protein
MQPDDGPVTEATYVEVMVDLLLLDSDVSRGRPGSVPEEETDSARAEVLMRYGVTADEIMHFAESAGPDAARMERLWQQITSAYDSTRSAEFDRRTEARSEADGKLGENALDAVSKADSSRTAPSPIARDSVRRRRLESPLRRSLTGEPSDRPRELPARLPPRVPGDTAASARSPSPERQRAE